MTQPFSLKQTLTYVCLPVDRYERLRELERRLHENDSEDAIRSKEAAHVKNMQVVFAQQCQQYEATIANMQHQLAMASSGTSAGAKGQQQPGAGGGQKGQLGSRVAELQSQGERCNHLVPAVASAKQPRLAVNDLRTFYSKKVRSLEDQAREAQARATAAEKKLRESREKWASTKAKQTARLTYLERQVAQRDGKPGEMDRLRAELQVWLARFPLFLARFPQANLVVWSRRRGRMPTGTSSRWRSSSSLDRTCSAPWRDGASRSSSTRSRKPPAHR